MKFNFRNLPIRRKLTLIILLTSFAALALVSVAMVTYEILRFRHALVRELSTEAEIIAENSAAPLAFVDTKAARDTLRALQAQPGIVHARLFTPDGKTFAEYKSFDDETELPDLKGQPAGHRFEDGYLLVFRDVLFGGGVVGSLALRSDLREQNAWLQADVSIAVVALFAALLVALILSLKLQQVISTPILELAEVAHQVTLRKNYSLRATKRSGDEIGLLMEEFNQMLEQIEKRDADLRASEERFRQLAETIREVFWLSDIEKTKVIYISPGFEAIWGRSLDELEKSPRLWVECLHSEDRDRVWDAVCTKQVTGEYDVEYRVIRPDGTVRWIHDRAFPVRDAAGAIYRIAGIAEDITERKRAEENLRRTEWLYRQAIVGAGAVPYARDFKSRSYLFMGEGIEQLIGYPPHEVSGDIWEKIKQEYVMLGESAGWSIEEAGRRVITGEVQTWRCDIRVLTRDGQSRWISDVAVQNRDESGKVIGSMGILQDITERKLAEKKILTFSSLASRLSAAATAEEAAANILETAAELIGWDCGFIHLYDRELDRTVPVLTFDLIDGKRTLVSAPDNAKPSPMTRLIIEKGALLVDAQSRASLPFGFVPFGNKDRVSASMMYVPIRQGENFLGILSIQRYSPDAYNQGNLDLLQALADHCSGALQRIRATKELLETEAKYRTIFESATEGIFQTSPEGKYLRANLALARMFGYESPAEMSANVMDIEKQTYVLPERRREFKRLLEEQGEVHGFEAERFRRDGSRFWISVNARVVRDNNGAILYYEGTTRDVTSRRHLEKQLIEISDREQSRMGQDLHDGLCQHLVRTAFAANLLEKDLSRQKSAFSDQAKKVARLVDDSITQARNLARGLYPVKLESEGFHSAMVELAANIRATYHLDCEFKSAGSISIDDHAVSTHLYRIAQEAAINAVKHSSAKKIQIRVSNVEEKIHLVVSDDGVGIGAPSDRGNGMGLHIMNYRAGMIGAELKVEAQKSGGTIVTCIFEHPNRTEKIRSEKT